MMRYQLNCKNSNTLLTRVDLLGKPRPCTFILYQGINQGHILKSWNIVQSWFAKRTRDIQSLMILCPS